MIKHSWIKLIMFSHFRSCLLFFSLDGLDRKPRIEMKEVNSTRRQIQINQSEMTSQKFDLTQFDPSQLHLRYAYADFLITEKSNLTNVFDV